MARTSVKSRAQPIFPEGLSLFFSRRLREGSGLLLLSLGAFFLIALAGYNPADPSFNSTGAGTPTNPLGVPGAHAADLALQTLGLAGGLPAFAFFAWGARQVLKKGVSWPWIRALFLIISLPFIASALSALTPPAGWPMKSGLGGVLGQVMGENLFAFLSSLVSVPAFRPWMLAVVTGSVGTAALIFSFGYSAAEWAVFGRASARLIVAGARRANKTVLGAVSRTITTFQKLVGLKNRLADAATDIGDKLPDSDAVKNAMAFEAPSFGFAKLKLPRLSFPVLGRVKAPKDNEKIEPVFGDAPQYVSGQDMASQPIELDQPIAQDPHQNTDQPRTGLVEPRKAKPKLSKKAVADRQKKLNLGVEGEYDPPSLDLLDMVPSNGENKLSKDALEQNAKMLASVLEDFGVKGEIVKVRPGPVVTLYELIPAPGTKTSRVIGLADDIARSMSAVSVRVAVVPGQNVIGIELPNVTREMVYLRELLEASNFEKTSGKLNLALGKDIGGQPMAVDLARMPHLLISGTTGSGKSVGINTMILSLLYHMSPDECRFIMIDPKMLELSVYEGIPHLLTPVVTDPKKAVVALKWTVREMEDRYKLMSQLGVRNIAGYNKRIAEARKRGEVMTRKVQTGFDDSGKPVYEDQPLSMDPLPFIVVVVDEMADLMLVAGKDIEGAVQRLAQMARAAGIHLIMATQRPSVDVITGTIKANFPTRVSFQVTSRIDSRTILGEPGAENLLGQGDMLYMAGGGRITRVHGPFCSDEEVEEVVAHLKAQGQPAYLQSVTEEPEEINFSGGSDAKDDLYDQAVALVAREGKASTSFIQRHLQIGYNRAARIVEQMEKDGVVSPANRVGRRDVLIGAGREMAS